MSTAPLPRRLLRVLSWHRRKFAAGFAAIAVVSGINAAAPPDPPTVAVVLTGRPIAAGSVLSADDLRTVQRPAAELPEGAISEPSSLLGRTAVAALPRGQVLTSLAVSGPARVGAGRVLVPLRLADAELAQSLRPGDVVDVVAADDESGDAAVIGHGVRVVAVPPAGSDRDPLASDQSGSGVCLVDADPREATLLAGADITRRLSVLWRR